MFFRHIFILIFLFSFDSFSQIDNQEYAQKLYVTTLNHIDSGLSYLAEDQKKEGDSIFQFKGEWESQMSMNFWFPLLGKESSEYDSNCFSVSTIHNILADIYLQYPEYREIPPMLDLAFERIMHYETNGTFNFWNLLPPTKTLRWFERDTNELIRRPNNFPLNVRFVQKAANVVNDADDTAAGLMAIYLQNQVKEKQTPDSLRNIHEIFDGYTDSERDNRHWYNFWQKQGPKTGAYLTWLSDEYQFSKKWNPVQEFFHLGTFYLPTSKMYPHAYEPYIPYGSNDLDVVVNANILGTLSLYKNTSSNAVQNAVEFIEQEIRAQNYDYAATYYSNRYHIPYYISKAYSSGVTDLKESCELIEDYVLSKHKNNNSWSSRDVINRGDSLQSSILAVNTLLNISGLQSKESEEAILAGLEYIFSKGIVKQNGIYWEGGVFFSGGTLVRHVLHWKSDAVTTALVLEGLVKVRKQLEAHYPDLSNSR